MQGVMTRRRMQVESHVEFRIDHRDKLTGDHKSTFAKHDAKVSDTTDKATYVKVPAHKADSFKSAMKGHGAKVELAEGLKHHVAAAAIAVAGALGGHAHAQSAPSHSDTAKPAATATAQDSDKSPHDGAPKADHKARIDKAESEGSMTRGDANVERMKHGLRPSFGRARLQQESHAELAEGLGRGAEDDEGQGSGRNPRKDFFSDRPHTVHIDGKPWKKFSNGKQANAAASTLKIQGKKATVVAHFKEETNLDEEGEGGVPANNAGDGKVAGFAGDAGKKVKMMSEPLKRKPMPKFKAYVSQEHENN
jgi:hypothetical protein